MIDNIIKESLHSLQYGVITNQEFKAIYDIISHVKIDIEKNKGNRSKNAHNIKVVIYIDGIPIK